MTKKVQHTKWLDADVTDPAGRMRLVRRADGEVVIDVALGELFPTWKESDEVTRYLLVYGFKQKVDDGSGGFSSTEEKIEWRRSQIDRIRDGSIVERRSGGGRRSAKDVAAEMVTRIMTAADGIADPITRATWMADAMRATAAGDDLPPIPVSAEEMAETAASRGKRRR